MNNRHLICLLLLVPAISVLGDDRVRSTQEELRRRNVYFGDVDGRPSRELEEALKRYQSRKGLSATGREDRETLRSLGLATREQGEAPPKEMEWPDEPVLKSDAKLDVVAAAEELSTSSGVSVASLAPNRAGSSVRRRRANLRAATPDEPEVRSSRGRGSELLHFSTRLDGKLKGEITNYIRAYLKAVGRNRLEDELHYYADRVNYMGNGAVDRRIIEQSLRKYYQRWPSRSYAQVGGIGFRAAPGRGEIVVDFRTEFSLRNSKSRASGVTATRMVINAATADPRIVSITEQRVRR